MSLTFIAMIVRPRLRSLISENVSSSVGTRTSAKLGWNQRPASNRFNSANVNSRTDWLGPSVVRPNVSSCSTTSLPSFVVRMSNSKPIPNSKQVANAGNVFSGACRRSPRCATRIGSAACALGEPANNKRTIMRVCFIGIARCMKNMRCISQCSEPPGTPGGGSDGRPFRRTAD